MGGGIQGAGWDAHPGRREGSTGGKGEEQDVKRWSGLRIATLSVKRVNVLAWSEDATRSSDSPLVKDGGER